MPNLPFCAQALPPQERAREAAKGLVRDRKRYRIITKEREQSILTAALAAFDAAFAVPMGSEGGMRGSLAEQAERHFGKARTLMLSVVEREVSQLAQKKGVSAPGHDLSAPGPELSGYEISRQNNVTENERMLRSLGLMQ